jgi:hypothetical protein
VDASLAAFKRKTGIGTARLKNYFSGSVSLAIQAGATVIQIKVGTGHVASVVNTITEPGRQQPD